jgi:hypothetical protein
MRRTVRPNDKILYNHWKYSQESQKKSLCWITFFWLQLWLQRATMPQLLQRLIVKVPSLLQRQPPKVRHRGRMKSQPQTPFSRRLSRLHWLDPKSRRLPLMPPGLMLWSGATCLMGKRRPTTPIPLIQIRRCLAEEGRQELLIILPPHPRMWIPRILMLRRKP